MKKLSSFMRALCDLQTGTGNKSLYVVTEAVCPLGSGIICLEFYTCDPLHVNRSRSGLTREQNLRSLMIVSITVAILVQIILINTAMQRLRAVSASYCTCLCLALWF